jgi:integrase
MATANAKIGVREIRALKPGQIIWDASVKGFGARRQRGDAVAYFLKYRTADGRQRWMTIGRHGSPWTPDMARDRAKALLGEIVAGADPSTEKIAMRRALTVEELCERYFEDASSGKVRTRSKLPKKASTLAIDRGRIDRHIKPLLGKMSVASVKRHDIEKFLHDVADGKTAGRTKTKMRGLARVAGGETAANRAVGLLGAIFSYAVRNDLRSDNPVRGVSLFADRKKERRMSDGEYAQFGSALRQAEAAIWPPAVAAARFIALTGFRRGEVLALRWAEVDIARRTAMLAETKTGKSMRPLSRAACAVLRKLSATSDLVFPASRGNGQMTGFPKLWARIAKLSAFPDDVTPHVLRHSFASLAADLGYSEPTIAALIGHKGRTITSRYVHSADAVLLAAADAVSDRIAELLGDAQPAGAIVSFRAPSQNESATHTRGPG